jgi:hypothetical protein
MRGEKWLRFFPFQKFCVVVTVSSGFGLIASSSSGDHTHTAAVISSLFLHRSQSDVISSLFLHRSQSGCAQFFHGRPLLACLSLKGMSTLYRHPWVRTAHTESHADGARLFRQSVRVPRVDDDTPVAMPKLGLSIVEECRHPPTVSRPFIRV